MGRSVRGRREEEVEELEVEALHCILVVDWRLPSVEVAGGMLVTRTVSTATHLNYHTWYTTSTLLYE